MKKYIQSVILCILYLICTPAALLIGLCSVTASFLIKTPDVDLPNWLYKWGEFLCKYTN